MARRRSTLQRGPPWQRTFGRPGILAKQRARHVVDFNEAAGALLDCATLSFRSSASNAFPPRTCKAAIASEAEPRLVLHTTGASRLVMVLLVHGGYGDGLADAEGCRDGPGGSVPGEELGCSPACKPGGVSGHKSGRSRWIRCSNVSCRYGSTKGTSLWIVRLGGIAGAGQRI